MTDADDRAGDERALALDVSILGRDYRVACKAGEREDLLEAVALIDRRMREIRDAGKVSGVDRIAVMAALNIANELLRERKTRPGSAAPGVDAEATERRIRSMTAAIDKTLAGQDKLF